jgi:6-phosphofructokinase 2
MKSVSTLTMNPAVDLSTETQRVEPVHKLRCQAAKRDPGGGGINVARVLQRFGTPCSALYPSGGRTGALLHDLLVAEGIDSLPVGIVAETRENVTVTESTTGYQYRFVLPGPALRPEEWRACLARLSALKADDFLVASGSLPPGLPPDFYREVVRLAAGRGVRTIIDSSGSALAGALEEGVFLVKPNLRELSELVGRQLIEQEDWETAAAELVDAGAAEVVALSLGDRGAFLASRTLRLHAPGVPIQPVSAVGAGDSFVAGMVSRLAVGADLRSAFAYAVAAGTAALLTPGTELCRPEDVERLYRDVRLQERRVARPDE